jgi:hypothetical protein
VQFRKLKISGLTISSYSSQFQIAFSYIYRFFETELKKEPGDGDHMEL